MSFVYDEDSTLIADTLTGGATTTWGQSARYIYLPTASGPMPVAAIYGTKHYAIQSDHLNTPRRLVQSDGQVAWQWAYSAFGDEQPTIAKNRFANTALNQSFGSTMVPAVTFNLRYPGQYFDQESGLHYNYHRSYSATTGRYTQSDPIGLDGGWNRYSYVGQNPLQFTDPLGLQIASGGSGAGGLGAGGAIGSGSSGSRGGYDPRSDTYSPPRPGVGERIINAIKEFCYPDDPDPCKGIRDQLKAHEKKLADYLNDPLSQDNRGLLGGAILGNDGLQAARIFEGRVKSLRAQIEHWKRELKKCEEKNGK
jgi:RHS repeat-associated protein